jgi:penicillin-insensitive murein DD-endopeptidase
VALLVCLLAPLGGCVGVYADDGSSISLGTHARGALLHGVLLPDEGAGYRVPAPWRARGRQYATEEVVRWLTGAFRRVAVELPGSVAPLGDLSGSGGGRSVQHKSHGSGRDIDIFYYAIDGQGQPLRPEQAMLRFRPDGEAVAWSPPTPDRRPGRARPARVDRVTLGPVPEAHFDARRNWALVRAMLSDPTVEVQWIFIHRSLADLMLRQGPTASDDPALVARAAALMHQPADAQPHDDHMHVRVYCEPSDRALGCQDRGPQRWWKKRWKYLAGGAPASAPAGIEPRALEPPALEPPPPPEPSPDSPRPGEATVAAAPAGP